ncbi:vimentin-like [Gossypium australe]|uniref:Vimentin-like n=1 Tax=Gossypium australe TaxID=47621 RepID=A0A5B6V0I3_9ROSI|nr:vimentin-like [Gossypium australe]
MRLRLGPSTRDMGSYWICPSTCINAKKVREISNAWNQTHKMKRFATNLVTTPEYDWWWSKRVNDNVLVSCQENTRLIEEHLQVILSEREIVKQDFENKSSELGKKIEKLEEKKI